MTSLSIRTFFVGTLVLLALLAPAQADNSLGVDSATLNLTGDASGGAAWSTVANTTVAPTLAAGGSDVLVISSFSSSLTVPGSSTTGIWRLTDGSTAQVNPIERYMANDSDVGNGTVVSLFSGVSQGTNFSLEHYGTNVTTLGVNTVAIPVAATTGAALTASMATQTGTYTTTGNTPVPTTFQTLGAGNGVATSLALQGTSRIFVAASLNSNSNDSGSRTGTWRLEMSDDGSTWAELASPIYRYMAGPAGPREDIGAVTMYGMTDVLAADTYEFRITVRTNTDDEAIVTENATLVALGLAFDDGSALEGFVAPTPTPGIADGDGEIISGATHQVILDKTVSLATDSQVFLAAAASPDEHMGATTTTMSLEMGAFENQPGQRFISDTGDFGSVGIVGLTDTLTAGSYDPDFGGEVENNKNAEFHNAILVGFATTVPEPATMSLLALGGLGVLARRRRKRTA